ncbi:MAG: serine/threonine protein kinase, partial [Acidobacteria bacterium]|nr:serine/threonine protein kinase [Acidobacteriota bacterium]
MSGCVHPRIGPADALLGACPLCLLGLGLDSPVELSAERGEAFTPGTVINDRFRITALLGRGGMGEVYRAEDLRLGQTVALKFVSQAIGHNEVRVGRQVAHPNVCRLYDLFEHEGQPFIAMELVDGEDLASLMERVRRLERPAALAIGRGICAGLAASHDRQVVHGDLKPANVMIDGRGQARITDFGLAMAAGELPRSARVGGTLAYMAPEQLEGVMSARGDLYSLALVLYELLTGERLHDVRDVAELRKAFTVRVPRMRGIPAELEEAIVRCLAVDPANRPASAREVLAAFPGGNPLDAAVAAGETPSPELVAAAEQSVPLAPAAAWLAMSLALVGLFVVALIKTRVSLEGQTPVRSPAVLTERARSFTRGPAIDSAAWFEKTPGREAIRFQYRQGPLPLVSKDPDGLVTLDDPPSAPGMETVSLTAAGERLPEDTAAVESAPLLYSWVYLLLLSPLLVAGLIVARHNTRAGRGDARGARRLAAWVFACRMLHWLLLAHHVGSFLDESTLIYAALARSLLHAAEVWIGYLAVEPYIRRHRPRTIVSWKRLLEGQWRDSVVGRDVLIGAAFGIVMVLIELAARAISDVPPLSAAVPALTSARWTAALLFYF